MTTDLTKVGQQALSSLQAMLAPDTVMLVDADHRPEWVLCHRRIANATDGRTGIAAVVPFTALSHSAQIVDPGSLLDLPSALRQALSDAEAEAETESRNPRLFG